MHFIKCLLVVMVYLALWKTNGYILYYGFVSIYVKYICVRCNVYLCCINILKRIFMCAVQATKQSTWQDIIGHEDQFENHYLETDNCPYKSIWFVSKHVRTIIKISLNTKVSAKKSLYCAMKQSFSLFKLTSSFLCY